MAKRISELFSRFFSVVVGDSSVGSQMGFHKPPAHVGSFVLLECRCYNPTGKMFFWVAEVSLLRTPVDLAWHLEASQE